MLLRSGGRVPLGDYYYYGGYLLVLFVSVGRGAGTSVECMGGCGTGGWGGQAYPETPQYRGNYSQTILTVPSTINTE